MVQKTKNVEDERILFANEIIKALNAFIEKYPNKIENNENKIRDQIQTIAEQVYSEFSIPSARILLNFAKVFVKDNLKAEAFFFKKIFNNLKSETKSKLSFIYLPTNLEESEIEGYFKIYKMPNNIKHLWCSLNFRLSFIRNNFFSKNELRENIEAILKNFRPNVFDVIPADIIKHILSFLSIKDLLAASLVSKTWNSCSKSDLLWSSTIRNQYKKEGNFFQQYIQQPLRRTQLYTLGTKIKLARYKSSDGYYENYYDLEELTIDKLLKTLDVQTTVLFSSLKDANSYKKQLHQNELFDENDCPIFCVSIISVSTITETTLKIGDREIKTLTIPRNDIKIIDCQATAGEGYKWFYRQQELFLNGKLIEVKPFQSQDNQQEKANELEQGKKVFRI